MDTSHLLKQLPFKKGLWKPDYTGEQTDYSYLAGMQVS